MLKTWEFWTLTAVAVVAGVLAGTNAVLFTRNQSVQAEVAQRAQYVQQSVQLDRLYREIVHALADLSVRNQDAALRDLLAAQGITLPTGPAAPAARGDSAAEVKKESK